MISAIILTKNEENNIKGCLESLSWCEELIVIDDDSDDRTAEIAGKLGARVISHPLKEDFSQQRNFALQQAKGDWIFFVDADERVPLQLALEISVLLSSSSMNFNGFYLSRDDFFINKSLKHGETGKVKILRLAKKDAGLWKRKVDEVWEIKGKTFLLKNHLLHYSHLSLDQFLESINQRSTLNAEELFERGKKVRFFDWFKPMGKFIVNYLFYCGFLDGINGFVFAVLMSFHSFLVRGKLYLLWRRKG